MAKLHDSAGTAMARPQCARCGGADGYRMENFRREHLRLQQRSHYVITNGGDQPNVVPRNASVWYYFPQLDYPHILDSVESG